MNCVFNQEHSPNILEYKPQLETEMEFAPRIQKTLVVFGENKTIHLCMYGADNAATWLGDTCDTDDKAKHCPMFKPRVTLEQARLEFMEKLSDDEYVFNNYRDVATLQWVLGERVHEIPLTWVDRLVFWFKVKFWKPSPPLPQLPAADLPDNLWYDQKNDSTTIP